MNVKSTHRGGIYLVVLAATALIVTMALVGLELARRDTTNSVVIRNSSAARSAAESGVDLAIAYMQQSNWRSQVGDGNIAKNIALGNANFSVVLTDNSGGDITQSSFDQIKVLSTATSGDSKAILQAYAAPIAVVPDQLLETICTEGSITFSTGCTITGTGTIRAGGLATATLSTINLPVRAGLLPVGLTYAGGASALAGTLTPIDMTAVLNYYRNIGTAVPYASLVNGRIESCVVSQDVTPWGVTNANGIYIINCANNNVRVRNARIIGTLVFINATKDVDVDQSVNWQPGTTNYPAAICDSKINLIMDNAVLSEASQSINFNPAGAAGTDRIGTTDTDKLDTYPSRITGLVFSNTMTIGNKQKIVGALVAKGAIACSGTPQLVYGTSTYTSPAPGFATPGAIFLTEDSWTRALK